MRDADARVLVAALFVDASLVVHGNVVADGLLLDVILRAVPVMVERRLVVVLNNRSLSWQSC